MYKVILILLQYVFTSTFIVYFIFIKPLFEYLMFSLWLVLNELFYFVLLDFKSALFYSFFISHKGLE